MFSSTKKIGRNLRADVLERDGYQCALCGDTRTFQLHHGAPRRGDAWDVEENLITLCPACHRVAHGEYEYTQDFPFEQETAKDAIWYYMELAYEYSAREENKFVETQIKLLR
jgi:5-methylcytosine-specific restriction endonuclease McrA